MALEDEGGVINAIAAPSLYDEQRPLVMTAGVLKIYGVVQHSRACSA